MRRAEVWTGRAHQAVVVFPHDFLDEFPSRVLAQGVPGHFVAARVFDNRWVVPHLLDNVPGRRFQVAEEDGVGFRQAIGQRELLREHDALLVGGRVEGLRQDHAAAPETNHVHAGLLGLPHQLQAPGQSAAEEQVGWDQAAPHRPHRLAVEEQLVTSDVILRRAIGLHPAHFADAKGRGVGIEHPSAVGRLQLDLQLIERLWPLAVAPPQSRPVERQFGLDLIGARFEGCL